MSIELQPPAQPFLAPDLQMIDSNELDRQSIDGVDVKEISFLEWRMFTETAGLFQQLLDRLKA